MKKTDWKPDLCDACRQTTTYLLGIDRGSVEIVKAIAAAVRASGVNSVHPRKDGILTTTQWCNLARPRFHGLIAKVHGETGRYLLTTKGAQFLRGEPIPRYAIVSKSKGHQIVYFKEDEILITIRDVLQVPYWEGADFKIVEGVVVRDSSPGSES